MNDGLGFILFHFAFILFFLYFIFGFIFLLNLDKRYDVISHKSKSVMECDMCHRVITQSYITKKNIKDSEIDDIIQYSNNMLAL